MTYKDRRRELDKMWVIYERVLITLIALGFLGLIAVTIFIVTIIQS